MFGSAISSVEDIDFKSSKKIEGDYNFEIPEIVDRILHFCNAKEIIRLTSVSKIWREVGTSDILWRDVVSNKKGYLSTEKARVGSYLYFYDLDSSKENIFEKVALKYQKGYNRKRKLKLKKNKEDFEKAVSQITFLGVAIPLGGCIFLNAFFCPPVSFFFQLLLGILQYSKLEDPYDDLGCLGISLIGDCICCTSCSLYCICCCCCCCGFCWAQFFAFVEAIFFNGRFIISEDEDVYLLTSVSIITGALCIYCGGIFLLGPLILILAML